MDDRTAASRWESVESLLDAALTLPPARRRSFVARRTRGDAQMRRQVQQLLDAAQTRDGILDRPAAALLSENTLAPGLPAGTRLGAYRVIELVGAGGMGEVYRAERADGQFQQLAAIKLIRRDAIEHRDRFESERRLLAQLDHPGIARLFDAGLAADGRPWIAMEWVEGRSITQWCREHRSSLRERIGIFLQVCEAVAHAHRHLLVHRDLKPGNVLVTLEGRSKLLDFGVAKLLDGPDLAQTQAPVTPAYAAPEQLQGTPITTAADVHALGLLLFELLTGERPWHRTGMPLVQLVEKQLREPAPAPSSVAGLQPDPPVAPAQLRGDLDAITGKALRRRPEDRYETVDALAADLQRHLRGEPVIARRHARGYVLGRLLRRYRWGVAAVAALVLSLGAGLYGVAREARRAENEARRAEAVQAFLSDIFRANSNRQADPVKARQTTARELLDLGAAKIDTALADAPEARMGVLDLLSQLYSNLELRDEAVRLDRQRVDLARQLHGESSPELAEALVELAGSMHASRAVGEQGRVLAEAERILDRLGDHDSETRALLFRKQSLHFSGTDEKRSLDYAQRAVRIYEAKPASIALAEALCAQGHGQMKAGALEPAIASLSRAIAVSREVPEARNPNIDRYHAYLGEAQYRAMQLDGAEQSLRGAMALSAEYDGTDHVDYLQAQFRLGRVLVNVGKTREGLELLAAARELVLRIKGADAPFHTPDVLASRGAALVAAGAPAEGLADLEAAILIQRRYHPGTNFLAKMLENRATARFHLAQHDLAQADLEEAAAIRRKNGQAGKSEPFNGNVQLRVRLSLAQGDVAEAGKLLAAIWTGAGPISFDRLERDLLAAEVALAERRPEQAIELAAAVRGQVLQSRQADRLKNYAARADLMEGLGWIAQAQPAKAAPPLARAIALREEIDLPSSPALAQARDALDEILAQRALVTGPAHDP